MGTNKRRIFSIVPYFFNDAAKVVEGQGNRFCCRIIEDDLWDILIVILFFFVV